MIWRVLDDRDVGNGCATRHRAFQQVVAEHLVDRQPAAQQGMRRLHVQQPLAGKGALAKQVLVDLRARSTIRVGATLAGKQPVVRRMLARRGQRCGHPRLQNRITADHPSTGRVQAWRVVRMCGDAHQLAQAPRRQLRVAVKRHQITCARCQHGQSPEVEESAVGAHGERAKQQFQLASFALPADPAALGVAVAACAVQQDETRPGRRVFTSARISGVEQCHLRAGIVQQAGVGGGLRRGGVHPVSQQRELRLRLRVGQVVQLQAVCQPGGRQRATQHGRHHHHHPVLQRNRLPERQPRQMARPHRLADQAIHHRNHRLGRRQHRQSRRQYPQPIGPCSNAAARLAAPQRPPDQAPGKQQQRAQIGRKHHMPAQTVPVRQQTFPAHAQSPLQHRPPGATQPVAGNRLLSLGSTHPIQQRPAHHHLALSGAPRQRRNTLQGLISGRHVFGLEQGRCQHQAHQRAGARNDVRPIGVADRAQ